MGVVNIQKTYGSGAKDVLRFLDGTMTSFICPKDIDEIYDYTFYDMTSLQNVKIGDNVTQIKQYAFYGCNNVVEWETPRYLTSVGDRAFAESAKNGIYIDFNFNNTTIGAYAFYGSHLKNLIGYINNVGSYAFRGSGARDYSFTNLKIDGNVGSFAFLGRYTGQGFFIDGSSNITNIEEGAFCIVSNDSYYVPVYHVLDFRGSTFTSLPGNTFGRTDIRTMGLLRAAIYFPTSLVSISNYVFEGHKMCYYYFSNITPCLLGAYAFSDIIQWGGIFVPYNNINTYKTATNWTSVSQYIKGWAPENTFSVGETLPTVNQEGYGLTWYTDRECTTQISVVVDADVELYCVAST